MSKKLVLLAATALALTGFIACGDKEDDGEKLNYDLLYDCIWVPGHLSESADEIPMGIADPSHALQFRPEGKLVIMDFDDQIEKYNYLHTSSFILDKTKKRIKFTLAGEDYQGDIAVLCQNHMTVLFDPESAEYLYLLRKDMPDGEKLNSSTFPPGILR